MTYSFSPSHDVLSIFSFLSTQVRKIVTYLSFKVACSFNLPEILYSEWGINTYELPWLTGLMSGNEEIFH